MVADWPLVGRREELSIIEHTLSDRQYRGLLLAGAPGVGKTRLAREALAAAAFTDFFAIAFDATFAAGFRSLADFSAAAGASPK